MKNYIKSLIIIVALLSSMNVLAEGTIKVNGVTVTSTATALDNNGNAASASIANGKCTLTMIPSGSYYITADDISAIKTIDGRYAQTRTPGIDTPVTITATDDSADPSTETSYTFDVTDEKYDYEVTATFQSRISVEDATVEVADGTYTYTGSAIKPDVTITVGGVGLTKGTDCNVAYLDSINAGTGKVIIYGVRKYMGQNGSTSSPAATYTINPKSIADVTVTLSAESFTFNGENQKPTVTVKDGETNLVLDTDYTLTNEGGTNVGEYTVTVTGKGNYTGEVSKKYSITAATMEVTAEGYTGTYDGKAYGITVTAPEGATIKYGTAEGTYDLTASPTYTNADTYTVYYSVSKTNYADVTGSKNVVINPKSIANATVTLSAESFTFNGENQKPTVTVKDGETNLVLDTDYTLTNEGGTNVGEYTVTVTGKGNYTGEASKEYSITAATMEVTAEGYTGTYDGKAYGITVTAPEGATIKYGTSEGTYDLTASPTYTNAGTYTVYYSVSKTNYADVTGSKNVVINPKSIADVTVTLSAESFTFNGENQKPTVTVKDGETNLVLDTDYTLTNEGGTDVGKYTVTVTGKGNYTGEASKEYSITAATMEVTAEGYTGTYDGKAYGITVTAPEGATIKYGTAEGTYDLTASPTYTNAGTYTVYYSVSKTNYADVTGSKNVVINPKSIADVTVTLSAESFTFNGENQKPTVTVKDGETNLVLDTDYTLTNEGGTDAGKYTVTVTGKGNYTGEVSKEYSITANTMEVTAEGYTGTYDGKAYGITVTAPEGATIKYGTAEGTYDLTASPTYTNAGTYTVYYSVSKTNYADVTGSKNVVINPKSIANATVTLSAESFTFNGENQKPTVTVKDGETNLVLDTDYTLTNEGGTDAGKYTVTVTGKGNYSGTVSKEYSITANTMEVTAEGYTGTYDGKAHGITVTAPEGATIKYGTAEGTYDLTASPTYTNAGTYTVYYSVSMANYTDVTGSKNVVISPKSIADVTVTLSAESFTFNGENQKPTVTVKDGETNLVLDTDYTLTNEGGTDVGKYTVTVTGKGNYTGEASKEYSITAATMEVTAEGYTGTYDGKAYGITVTAPEGATIKYGTSEGTYDLTASPTYTNAGTYTVYYSVSKTNYADVTGSKNVVINKATATLSYSATTAECKMGEAFTAPTLNNPSQVAVSYSSSNTEVATIGTDGAVTLKGPGKTTITATFAGNDNYEGASASYELTVGKQQDAGLSWTDEGMEYYIGDFWYGPRLNNPNKLKVKYESSDEDVATIDEDGVVTVLGVGETWIMAIFEGSDEYEPQTVKYGLFVKERYKLWVGGQQVTSDNCSDILGNGQFFYNEDEKMLVVTNSTKAVDIENRKGDLTIFLNGNSKLGRIFFNKGETDNSGKLTITTYENIPGATTLETSDANGVISGFSSLNINSKTDLFLLDPEEGTYSGGRLKTAEDRIAKNATIGQYIKPLVKGRTIDFPIEKFENTKLTNTVVDNVHYALVQHDEDTDEDDDYYDPSIRAVVMNNLGRAPYDPLYNPLAEDLLGDLIPGSRKYASEAKSLMTFMVPDGKGKINLDVETGRDHHLNLTIGNGEPKRISKNKREKVEFDYDVDKPTYCFLFLGGGNGASGTRIVTRVGKREKSKAKLFSLKVSPTEILSSNPLGELPEFPDSQTPEVETFEKDGPSGINEIKVETGNSLESNEDNWYDLRGRRINKPNKAGFYIQNRKKVVIR